MYKVGPKKRPQPTNPKLSSAPFFRRLQCSLLHPFASSAGPLASVVPQLANKTAPGSVFGQATMAHICPKIEWLSSCCRSDGGEAWQRSSTCIKHQKKHHGHSMPYDMLMAFANHSTGPTSKGTTGLINHGDRPYFTGHWLLILIDCISGGR